MSDSIIERKSVAQRALEQAAPIILGYLPISFAFGILAASSGMSGVNAVFMSLLVYAGSAQLIAVGMFAAGISPYSIILTTFVVNLRHLLMSAALSPYLNRWRPAQLAAFGYELTDETFAVHSTRFAQGQTEPSATLLINLIAHTVWVAGTFAGVAAGGIITDVKPLGLDYALSAMFIALLVLQLKDRRLVVIALLGGLLSTGLLLAGVSQWNVIIATVIAATVGLGVEAWTKKSSS